MIRRLACIVFVLTMPAGLHAVVYSGPWLVTWDFSDGTQGWVKTAGAGYWVDPAVMPNGPTLPDGAPSGAGGGNLYSPDGTIWQLNLTTPVDRFVLQADFYVPNLMPLNLHFSLPGNGIQGTGVGARSKLENKLVGVGGRNNPDGVRLHDTAWNPVGRDRSWLMEEAGKSKSDPTYWDKWVTIQLMYNWNGSGKFTGAVYTPWDSQVHDGPGWYEFAEYDCHPAALHRFMDRLVLGAVVPGTSSWTQTQIDNVKFIPEPAALLLVLGSIPMLGRRGSGGKP